MDNLCTYGLFADARGSGIYFAALGPMMSTWEGVAPLLKTLPLERLTDTPLEVCFAAVNASPGVLTAPHDAKGILMT